MAKDFIVSVKPDTVRGRNFLKIFGRVDINVTSPIPFLAELPEFDEPQRVFLMDLKLLTPVERRSLVEHISANFNIPVEEVDAQLDQVGVPILDQDCFVIIENPQRWV